MLKKLTTLVSTCLLACIQISVGIAATQDGPEAELAKAQALIVTGQKSTPRAWRSTTPELRNALEKTGPFEVRMTNELRGADWAAAGAVAQPIPRRVGAMAPPDLEGIWGFDRSLFRQYSDPQYTAEGQRRVDDYDVSTDDPSYGCLPSGLGRAWDEPDTTAKIEQYDNRVVISYEMFDLVRTIELNQNGHPLQPEPSTVNIDGVPMPTMGHSIGWYEDDALVIETVGYAPGFITTLSLYPPQSEALRSIERIRRDEEDRLVVEFTYIDPIILTSPLTSTNRYFRSDFPFTVYGCVPDDHGGGE